jgi:hypothetical protein
MRRAGWNFTKPHSREQYLGELDLSHRPYKYQSGEMLTLQAFYQSPEEIDNLGQQHVFGAYFSIQ